MLWVILSLCVLLLILLGLLIIQLSHNRTQSQTSLKFFKDTLEILNSQNSRLMGQNRDLLNRLLSSDLQAFATMTALTNSQVSSAISDGAYQSGHDAIELQKIANAHGLGDTIYDDVTDPNGEEITNILQDFGYVTAAGDEKT